MRSMKRALGALGVAVAAFAVLTGVATASPAHHHDRGQLPPSPSHPGSHLPHRFPPPSHFPPPPHHRGASVFVQTDNPQGNAVVVYDRNPDGTLTEAGQYATGGNGGQLEGSVVDHTASQGALQLDQQDGLLYAVNAGSNSISVFSVDGDRLRLNQVVPSGGDFPVSIAVHGHLVYVLNAREGGSVQGFVQLGGRLQAIPSWNRALGLDPTATPEFTHTPGQIAFSPDGSKLIVTTKANGNDVDVFGLDPLGGISRTPTVTELPEAVPFAVSFDPAGNLVLAEAGPNAVASFAIGGDGSLTQLAQQGTGQAATCWIARIGGTFYLSNAGSASVSIYRSGAGGSLTAAGLASTEAGTIDAAPSADGRYLYVQTGAAGTVDEFRVGTDGSLTPVGSVTVPGAVGGEGIAAS